MSFEDFRRRAARVREVPLETVMALRNAVQDPRDRRKWRTEQGFISITGAKFNNWHRNVGGGGAIDLVMHLADLDVRAAVAWLEQHTTAGHAAGAELQIASGATAGASSFPCQSLAPNLRLPIRDDRKLSRIRDYLKQKRHLSPLVLERLIEVGQLYADSRGNAVFLLVTGKPNRPVGAELRGTTRCWRGMALGTRKDSGYFWVGGRRSRQIVLCESAIDAISCCMLYPDRICISTSGVRSNPLWLPGLLKRGYEIYCGFDADPPGDAAAQQMIRLHQVKRLRPPAKDWNAVLV